MNITSFVKDKQVADDSNAVVYEAQPVDDDFDNDDDTETPEKEELEVPVRKFWCFKRDTTNSQIVDAFGAAMSAIALIATSCRMAVLPENSYLMQLTEANTFVAPPLSDVRTVMQPVIDVDLTRMCTATRAVHDWPVGIAKNIFMGFWLPLISETPYEVSVTRVTYGETPFAGTTLHMEAGRYDPMAALVWVFTVSVVFQLARVWLFVPKGNIAVNNRALLFTQYRPYAGPEFWRWVEYAMTAPLQIVIVASTFSISDRAQLLSLGALQGALCLLGFPIELQLRKVAKHRLKIARGKDSSRRRGHEVKLVVLLWSAWALHGIIWFVLLERFQRQKDNLVDCKYGKKMPGAVNFIVYAECFLFTLFGVVPTAQMISILITVHSVDDARRSDTPHWSRVASAYTMLSVAAKSVLGYGFIILLDQIPDRTLSAEEILASK